MSATIHALRPRAPRPEGLPLAADAVQRSRRFLALADQVARQIRALADRPGGFAAREDGKAKASAAAAVLTDALEAINPQLEGLAEDLAALAGETTP